MQLPLDATAILTFAGLSSLVFCSQVDGDGKVSLSDFRKMLPSSGGNPPGTGGKK
jgi:hypothetical protein